MTARTDRFLARVEGHLRTLPDEAKRLEFLNLQIETWEERYRRFAESEGDSEPVTNPADPPSAFDFIMTITGLVRLRDLTAERAPALRLA